jgi:hypothetical protein
MSDQSPRARVSPFDRALARLLRASLVVDQSAVLFDRLRSRVVCTLAPDGVLEAYNALAYGGSGAYQPRQGAFRSEWFPWERRAVDAYFPPPPGRVLIGGAGGGREAYQLVARGYDVVAFDPVRGLVVDLERVAAGAGRLTAYVGSYETLPRLQSTRDGTSVTMEAADRFDAAICGWGSLAHVRRDDDRVAALRLVAALVDGPILISVYGSIWQPSNAPGIRGAASRWLYGDGTAFLPGIGRVQTFDEPSFRDLIARAGLETLFLSTSPTVDNWPHAVVRQPR